MKPTLTFLVAITLLAFLLPSQNSLAADGSPVWTNYFNGTGNGDDVVTAIALDTNGNVYVTGWSMGSGSGQNFVTIKYSAAGVAVWTNRFNGPENSLDTPWALAVDGSGNVYVTGTGAKYSTLKYSTEGVPLWTNLFNRQGFGFDGSSSIALDSNGNVYVSESISTNGEHELATIKYSNGGVALWTNSFNAFLYFSYGTSKTLGVDGSGNVYVTGASVGSDSGQDYATLKYSTDGVPLWTNFFSGTGNNNDYPTVLAVDTGGNVVVSGHSAVSGSDYDHATIKYYTTGSALWTNRFNVTGNSDEGFSDVALDASGNVCVTGEAIALDGATDIATIKYSPAGIPLWTNYVHDAAYYSPFTVVADPNGNAYVAGQIIGSGGDLNYVTMKYSGPPAPLRFVTANGGFGFTNQQFVLTLTGPAGSNAVISASTDLQSWVPLKTDQLSGGSLQFTDTLATNYLHRFYRANLK